LVLFCLPNIRGCHKLPACDLRLEFLRDQCCGTCFRNAPTRNALPSSLLLPLIAGNAKGIVGVYVFFVHAQLHPAIGALFVNV
jgi:hypothetical protein